MSDLWHELSRWPAGDRDAWRRDVDRVLKGRTFADALERRTAEGLTLQPLYTTDDLPSGVAGEVPGAAPFTRGLPDADSARPVRRGWLRTVEVEHPDIATANRWLLSDLEGGANRAVVHVRPAADALATDTAASGRGGVWMHDAADLEATLRDVLLPLAPVAVRPRTRDTAFIQAGFDACAALRARSGPGVGMQLDLLAHAWSAPSSAGWLTAHLATAVDDMARASEADTPWADARPLFISGAALGAAGADMVQELAAVVALFVEAARATEGRVAPAALVRGTEFQFAVGGDFFGEIARLRAFRRCLALVLDTLGARDAAVSAMVSATCAEHTLTRQDAHVNLLRTTAEATAAVCGGADAVSIPAFDLRRAGGTGHGRRLARNLHALLEEEGHVGAVADPAGGSFYIEHRTEQLAEAAWRQFVAWERTGGFIAACRAGIVSAAVDERAAARTRRLRTRKDVVLGVSTFVPPDETPVAETGFDAAAFVQRWRGRLGAVAPAPGSPEVTPLPVRYNGEAFEALRARAHGLRTAHGTMPTVVAVLAGEPSAYAARLDWVRDLLAAGGLSLAVHEMTEPIPDTLATIAATRAPVVLIAPDTLHGTTIPALTLALREAGARHIVVAGRAGDHAEAHREAGVTAHVFAGADVVAVLESLLAAVEATHAAA